MRALSIALYLNLIFQRHLRLNDTTGCFHINHPFWPPPNCAVPRTYTHTHIPSELLAAASFAFVKLCLVKLCILPVKEDRLIT